MSQYLFGLSSHSKRVLSLLLHETDIISTNDIASRLNLTPSQVRYCLMRIQNNLRIKGIDIIKKPRLGVKIDITKDQKELLLSEIRELKAQDLVLNKDERIQILLLQMLTTTEIQSRGKLLDDLGISRTSMYRDLVQARQWIEEQGLTIRTAGNQDVIVTGPEHDWRKALVQLLINNLSQDLLVEACVFTIPPSLARKAVNRPIIQEAYKFIKKLHLIMIEELISALEGNLRIIFTDQAHIYLCLSIGIQLYRVMSGHFVSESTFEDSNTRPYHIPTEGIEVIKNIMTEAEAIIGVSFSKEEEQFLIVNINDALDIGYLQDEQPGGSKRSDNDLAHTLANEAAKYLHVGLLHDQELIENLALELSTYAIKPGNQIRTRKSINGDDIVNIKSLNSFSRRLLRPILEKNGVIPNQTLLDACALHIDTALNRLGRSYPRRKVWLICGAGIATAQNMVSRLNLNIPDLEILGISSVFELARTPKLIVGADAVISTVYVPGLMDIPLIHVNPLLTFEDIEKIKKTLGLDAPVAEVINNPEIPHTGISLLEILRPETIDIDVHVKDWEAAVEKAGEMLLAGRAIWPSYIEAMKDMIHLYGPYMVVAPGAALLHAGPEMGGKQLSMSLVTLHKPVQFGHEVYDPVHLVLAFSSIDNTSHIRAVGEAMHLLDKKRVRQSIIDARTPDEILKIVHKATDTYSKISN